MSAAHNPAVSSFDKARHVKYWLRCLRTHLPTLYQSNDSTRMTLAFFIISALDLLDALHSSTTVAERAAYADWIYRCQHPEGGFRGFTGAGIGHLRHETNKCWDPANLAATYFALATLVVLGEDLGRVKRQQCLQWMSSLQLEDGSFGDALGEHGGVVGGQDVRYCYCAAGVRRILNHPAGNGRGAKDGDIEIKTLVRFLSSIQTYEGGFANAPFQEAHAGWTYCGVGALSLLDQLPSTPKRANDESNHECPAESSLLQRLLHWLTSRQTSVLQEDGEYEVSDENATEPGPSEAPDASNAQAAVVSSSEIPSSDTPSIEYTPDDLLWAGFNGRCNKVADTCYSFWAGGTLAILNQVHLMDFNANRRYLLDKTQHLIGGFGKLPGDPPGT
ncbi:MAG: hypothetical protein Q9191_003781 [Dirinaria sp. TL-2023a]